MRQCEALTLKDDCRVACEMPAATERFIDNKTRYFCKTHSRWGPARG